ncbi:ribonuclease H-like domain-containing protein [Chytridium lagenaria]|nr:ribonuclease H-like domain-containing protein [Chytridium lagenaria]
MKTNATTANGSRWLLEFLQELSFMGKAKSKFYSVRVGRRTGVYTTWRECEQNILGVSKAEFKSFATFEEAVNYLGTPADAPQVCPQATPVSNLPGASSSISRDGNGLLTFNQRATISSSPACSVSSLQSLGPSRKTPSKSKINDNDFVFDLEVYTDGSCLGNGKNHAKAGMVNISEKLPGSANKQQGRGAAIRALEATPKHLTYLRQVGHRISLWMTNWKKNGWKTAKGTPVLNQDLWQRLDMLIDFMRITALRYFGNEEADRLANEGAWL